MIVSAIQPVINIPACLRLEVILIARSAGIENRCSVMMKHHRRLFLITAIALAGDNVVHDYLRDDLRSCGKRQFRHLPRCMVGFRTPSRYEKVSVPPHKATDSARLLFQNILGKKRFRSNRQEYRQTEMPGLPTPIPREN